MTPAPRILVVSGEQWPRALVRAQLDEAGYDAIGARTLSRALRHPPDDAERGPLRLVVVDSRAAAAEPIALQPGCERPIRIPLVANQRLTFEYRHVSQCESHAVSSAVSFSRHSVDLR